MLITSGGDYYSDQCFFRVQLTKARVSLKLCQAIIGENEKNFIQLHQNIFLDSGCLWPAVLRQTLKYLSIPFAMDCLLGSDFFFGLVSFNSNFKELISAEMGKISFSQFQTGSAWTRQGLQTQDKNSVKITLCYALIAIRYVKAVVLMWVEVTCGK